MRRIRRIISGALEGCEALLELGRRGGFLTLAIAFAIGAVAWPIFHLDSVRMLGKNGLDWEARVALAITTAVVFGLFLALFAGLVWWRRRAGATTHHTISRINDALLWTLGLPLLVFLGVGGIEKSRPFFTLALIVGVSVLVGTVSG